MAGSTNHIAVYIPMGVILIIVFTVGFPLCIGAALLRMHLKNKRTDNKYIERLGWVKADMRRAGHNLQSAYMHNTPRCIERFECSALRQPHRSAAVL
jgi:hypothetical protein